MSKLISVSTPDPFYKESAQHLITEHIQELIDKHKPKKIHSMSVYKGIAYIIMEVEEEG